MTDDRYTHVTWHDGGHTVNKWTAAALEECERRLGYSLTVVQGSYNTSVGASAGTHAGGGAVDLMPYDWENKVHVLRAVGFAAWHRPTLPGVWNEHIHAILIGDEDASPEAKAQITDYRNHRDGLASHAADNTWHPDPIPTFHYPPKPPPEPKRRLTLSTFNVERARPKNVAVGDVMRLWDKHELDGLALQEAEGYFNEFRGLRDSNGNRLTLFADPENPENAILLRDGRGSDFLSADYGDGWTRAGGAHRGPGVFPRVTIDGWCRFASIHYPPSTTWPGGVLHTPDARRDDVVDIAEKAQAFLGRDNLTRVIGGDWNEPPTTEGAYTPLWVARTTDSQIQAPRSREGHGRIDFAIVKRGRMENVVKDTDVREGSDHEPVVFEVVEP